MSRPRLVAIDYGTKRVGLALADPLRIFAQPHGTFTPDEAVAELKRIEARDGLETIVVGWPLTPEGEEGEATAFVQPFVNRLRNAFPEAEIVKLDERHTSEMARDALREAGLSHTRARKGRVDATAAAIILQDYLERR